MDSPENRPTQELKALVEGAHRFELDGDATEAAKLYRRATILFPSSEAANCNLGYLLLLRGNIPGAIASLGRSLDSASESSFAGLLLPSFHAESLPSTKGGPDPGASHACLMLGQKLQQIGRFQEATECFRRSISLNPTNGGAYYALCHSTHFSSHDDPLLKEILTILEAPDIASTDEAQIRFGLGKVLDDIGEYGQAIVQFDLANQIVLRLQGRPFDRDSFRAYIDSLIRNYGSGSGQGSDSELPLLIVGMMRSGTTLAEQILSCHPEVTAGEELVFWRDQGAPFMGPGSRPPSPAEANAIAKAYLGILREIGPTARRVTDKMPQNFAALGLIHRVFPKARIICCRRNPVDTCLSIYTTSFRHPMPFVSSRSDIVFFYRQFERLMNHWHEVVPSDRLIEVRYEDLVCEREQTTRRMIEFAGLEWSDACLRPEQNVRPVKTASVWQVRQPVYGASRERWRKYEPWLGELAELREDRP
jgi:hypothetical protein